MNVLKFVSIYIGFMVVLYIVFRAVCKSMQEWAVKAKISQEIVSEVQNTIQELKNAIAAKYDAFFNDFMNKETKIAYDLEILEKSVKNLMSKFNQLSESIKECKNVQEFELNALKKELHKTQNMLSKCKKKMIKLKEEENVS